MQFYFGKDIILTFLVRRRYYFHFHGISMLKVQSLAQQPTWILTKFGLPFSALSKLSKWWKQSKTVKNILYFHHEYRICTYVSFWYFASSVYFAKKKNRNIKVQWKLLIVNSVLSPIFFTIVKFLPFRMLFMV